MVCRRKTKSERELIADINKVFDKFCKKKECRNCPYKNAPNCKIAYLLELLEKEYKNNEEE